MQTKTHQLLQPQSGTILQQRGRLVLILQLIDQSHQLGPIQNHRLPLRGPPHYHLQIHLLPAAHVAVEKYQRVQCLLLRGIGHLLLFHQHTEPLPRDCFPASRQNPSSPSNPPAIPARSHTRQSPAGSDPASATSPPASRNEAGAFQNQKTQNSYEHCSYKLTARHEKIK